MNIQETARLIRAISEEYSQNQAAGDWVKIEPGCRFPAPFQPVLVQYIKDSDDCKTALYSIDWVSHDGKWTLNGGDFRITHWAEIMPAMEVKP